MKRPHITIGELLGVVCSQIFDISRAVNAAVKNAAVIHIRN